MTVDTQSPSTWWGKFNFEQKQSKQWCIGPLNLIVRRLNNEWQIAHERSDDIKLNWKIVNTEQLPETLDNNSRYVFQETTGQLTITPLLADRPVIARPRMPFNLPAGEEATLYVSSPLWLKLATGQSSEKELEDIAIQRPSDTWFGPSTQEGELCYASATHCRLNLDELPPQAHRAITPVLIRNNADTVLVVERLNLPAPLLPLYTDAANQLWTPKITLIRERDGDLAQLKIDDKAPDAASQAEQISSPRNDATDNALFRAFNTVFS